MVWFHVSDDCSLVYWESQINGDGESCGIDVVVVSHGPMGVLEPLGVVKLHPRGAQRSADFFRKEKQVPVHQPGHSDPRGVSSTVTLYL